MNCHWKFCNFISLPSAHPSICKKTSNNANILSINHYTACVFRSCTLAPICTQCISPHIALRASSSFTSLFTKPSTSHKYSPAASLHSSHSNPHSHPHVRHHRSVVRPQAEHTIVGVVNNCSWRVLGRMWRRVGCMPWIDSWSRFGCGDDDVWICTWDLLG